MGQARIFVFYRLRDGVGMDDYVAWSQNTDQKITPGLEAIDRFEVFRVTETIEGAPSARVDVIEVIDVSTVEAWKAGNVSDYMKQVQEEWPSYASTEGLVVCAAVAIPPKGE